MKLTLSLSLLLTVCWLLHTSREEKYKMSRRNLQKKNFSQERSNSSEDNDSCKENCDLPTHFCSCDISCYLYGDCCDSSPLVTSSFEDRQIHMVSYYTSCFPFKNFGIRMINECPENKTFPAFSNDIKLKQVLPVTDENNITFRNKYYAECHGVSRYIQWRLQFSSITHTCYSSLLADPLLTLMSNKSFSPSLLAEYLLESDCGYNVYPPKHRTAHFCSDNILPIKNCSDTFRPVFDVPSQTAYRNQECCRVAGLCKTEEEFTCLYKSHKIYVNPFVEIHRLANVDRTSMVLLDLTGKNEESTSRIQYINIKFVKTFTAVTDREINEEIIFAPYCLLERYFHLMTDALITDRIQMHVEKTTSDGQSPIFASSYKFVLLSNRLYEGIEDIEEVSNWLHRMEMISRLNVWNVDGRMETYFASLTMKNQTDFSDNVNVSKTTFLYKGSKQRGLTSFHSSVIHPSSSVCRMLEYTETDAPPTSRCERLYVIAGIKTANLNIKWKCTVSFDNLHNNKVKNISSLGPSSTKGVIRKIIVMLILAKAWIL